MTILINESDPIIMFLLGSYIFLIGLLMGSFGSAIGYRVLIGDSWIVDFRSKDKPKPARSRCINCSTELKPLDLIPLFSWIASQGKCRYCKAPISWSYPLMELFGGMLAILFFSLAHVSLELLLFLITLPFFLALMWILLRKKSIQDNSSYSIPLYLSFLAFMNGATWVYIIL